MARCVHHVPGRARFKVPQFKRNPTLVVDVEEKIKAIDGVIRIETNVHAHSITVHYDEQANPLDKVVDQIRAVSMATGTKMNGHKGVPLTFEAANGNSRIMPDFSGTRKVGQSIGQAVFATVVQRTIERSLVSILTGGIR